MTQENITGFGRIPGDPLRIFTGNLRSSFGRTKEPVDQIQQLLTAGSVQAERRGQRMLIQTLEKLQPSARKPSVRITIQREHIYENAVVDRQMPCALLNIGRIGIPELAVDRRKSRIRAIILDKQMLRQKRCRMCAEYLVVLPVQCHVDIIVPGNEPPVLCGTQRAAANQKVLQAQFRTHLVKRFQQRKLGLLQFIHHRQ